MRDAEAYQEILFSIERFGSDRRDRITLLLRPLHYGYGEGPSSGGGYTLIRRDWHVPFPDLYEVVRDARNDALHHGASARHLTAHATQLVLVLEDALNAETNNNVGDYLVRDTVSAKPWQPVSFVRQPGSSSHTTRSSSPSASSSTDESVTRCC